MRFSPSKRCSFASPSKRCVNTPSNRCVFASRSKRCVVASRGSEPFTSLSQSVSTPSKSCVSASLAKRCVFALWRRCAFASHGPRVFGQETSTGVVLFSYPPCPRTRHTRRCVYACLDARDLVDYQVRAFIIIVMTTAGRGFASISRHANGEDARIGAVLHLYTPCYGTRTDPATLCQVLHFGTAKTLHLGGLRVRGLDPRNGSWGWGWASSTTRPTSRSSSGVQNISIRWTVSYTLFVRVDGFVRTISFRWAV